ncbi:MAG: ROK family protein [Planctomycetota bacterium]
MLAGDLGGTKCRFALISADFAVHAVQHVPTVRDRGEFLRGFDRALAQVLASLPSGMPSGMPAGIPAGMEAPIAAGFGVAGVIPRDGRSIDRAPNLPLDGFLLADHVQAKFGVPATVLNDGRASAWGEFLRGHAVGRDPLLCLFFGTGIGIGLIVDGKPYGGFSNAAGEIGHTTFAPGGLPCPCGAFGHFEAYCGGRAIIERAVAEIGPAADGVWTVGGVVTRANAGGSGSEAAKSILNEAESAACALVANACTLLNPSAVVLGGGVMAGWPGLRERIEAHTRKVTGRLVHEGLLFAPSLGGSDAILWGAAAATGALWPPPR